MSVDHSEPPQEDENTPMEGVRSEAEEREEFSFLQETIKDEQPSGKRTFYKIIKIAGSGAIFGLAACVGFFMLKPWVETQFQKEPPEIIIPQDSDEKETPAADDAAQEETPMPQEMTIESYQEMNAALYGVAAAANKCMVEVTALREGHNWLEDAYDTKDSVSGVFYDDNGQEILILTYSSITKDAEGLSVTFADNQSYSASLKKRDENLGLAVVSVPRSSIKQGTWSQIAKGVLGNSNLTAQGEGVIALGKQFGYDGSMACGIVSSARNTIMKADGEYSIITTDITATSNGTGLLFNLKGEIVGLIDQTISNTDSMNLVTAYAISNLKGAVQELSNGKGVPYVGIWGIDISKTTATEQGIPEGIYVKEVNADSPAMKAGIKSGDIITSFKGDDMITLKAYNKKLMECGTGQAIKIEGKRQGPEGYVDISFDVTVGSLE